MNSLTSREKLRAKVLLLSKATGKVVKEQVDCNTVYDVDRKLLLMTEQECHNLVSWMKYTGLPLTSQQMIEKAYPSHELIIEMDDGRVFTLNTDSYSLNTIVGRYIDLDEYLRAFGMLDDWQRDKEFFESQRANIRIPGAKNIYYMEC